MIKTGLIASIIIIAAMIATSIFGWVVIPEDAMIARHWDMNGEETAFSPRNHVLIALPSLAVFTALVFAAIPVIDPRRANVAKSQGLLIASWISGLSLLGLIHAAVLINAVTGYLPSTNFIMSGAGILLIVVGNYMTKSRSNWFLGIRTPWTLMSEHAWVIANRAGGWGFVLTGVLGIFGLWTIGTQLGISVLLAGAISAALISVILSYLAWRSDPNRPQ